MQEGPEGVRRLPEKLQGMAGVHIFLISIYLSFVCITRVCCVPNPTNSPSPWKNTTTGGTRHRRGGVGAGPKNVGGERAGDAGARLGAGEGLWVRVFVYMFI